MHIKNKNTTMSTIKVNAYDLISNKNPDTKTKTANIQRTIMFLITENCQLRCRYCYTNHNNTKLEFPVFKKAFDYILTRRDIFYEPKVCFSFFGGECFLEIKLLNKICEYITERFKELHHPWTKEYVFAVSSNGILYNTPEVQEFIIKYKNHLTVSITLDGTQVKHDCNRVYPNGKGSYNDVIKNIALWQSQFPDSATKVTVAHDDIPFIKESVLHLWANGISKVNINCVFEDVWEQGDDQLLEDQLIQLADLIVKNKLYKEFDCSFFSKNIGTPLTAEDNQNWCGSGKHMTAIDTYGDFYACNRFLPFTLTNQNPRSFGNAEAGINTNILRPYLALDRISQSPEQCLMCEFAKGCALCVGLNYKAADSDTIYQRAVYICKMHKARCRANNYYWDLREKAGKEDS